MTKTYDIEKMREKASRIADCAKAHGINVTRVAYDTNGNIEIKGRLKDEKKTS